MLVGFGGGVNFMASPAPVLVLGAFDILHWGHLEFLAHARRLGQVTIGLSGDDYLTFSKRPPLFTYDERSQALQRLGFQIYERSEADARDLFESVQPLFFVCGNDWLHDDHLASMNVTVDFLNELGCSIVYTPRDHHMSVSTVVERVLNHRE